MKLWVFIASALCSTLVASCRKTDQPPPPITDERPFLLKEWIVVWKDSATGANYFSRPEFATAVDSFTNQSTADGPDTIRYPLYRDHTNNELSFGNKIVSLYLDTLTDANKLLFTRTYVFRRGNRVLDSMRVEKGRDSLLRFYYNGVQVHEEGILANGAGSSIRLTIRK